MNRKLISYAILMILLAPVLVVGQVPSQQRRAIKIPQGSKTFNPNKANPHVVVFLKTLTFQTKGKLLMDPCGRSVILKGVNKLSVFDTDDPVGANYFREIAQTGANCVRIVWEMNAANPLSRLDQLISNARDNNLIPIVGLWDFTDTPDGGFSHLNDYANYWIRPAWLT